MTDGARLSKRSLLKRGLALALLPGTARAAAAPDTIARHLPGIDVLRPDGCPMTVDELYRLRGLDDGVRGFLIGELTARRRASAGTRDV